MLINIQLSRLLKNNHHYNCTLCGGARGHAPPRKLARFGVYVDLILCSIYCSFLGEHLNSSITWDADIKEVSTKNKIIPFIRATGIIQSYNYYVL